MERALRLGEHITWSNAWVPSANYVRKPNGTSETRAEPSFFTPFEGNRHDQRQLVLITFSIIKTLENFFRGHSKPAI
jgi:hypothetical protein